MKILNVKKNISHKVVVHRMVVFIPETLTRKSNKQFMDDKI